MWDNLILELIETESRVMWFNKRSPYVCVLLPKTWWNPETWQTMCTFRFTCGNQNWVVYLFINIPAAIGRHLRAWIVLNNMNMISSLPGAPPHKYLLTKTLQTIFCLKFLHSIASILVFSQHLAYSLYLILLILSAHSDRKSCLLLLLLLFWQNWIPNHWIWNWTWGCPGAVSSEAPEAQQYTKFKFVLVLG